MRRLPLARLERGRRLGLVEEHDEAQARDRQRRQARERQLEDVAKAAQQAQDHQPGDTQLVSGSGFTRCLITPGSGFQSFSLTWRSSPRLHVLTHPPRLKDSDVTWLYGPLHTAHVEPVRPLKVASTDERLGIDRPNPARPKTKPILKHRTLSEMLTIPMPSSPILESSYQEDDVDSIDGDHATPPRPHLMQTKSDTNIFRSRTGPVRRKSPPRVPSSSGKQTPKQGDDVDMQPDSATSAAQSGNKRHISFNTFVEQCVAVDDPTENHHADQDSDDEMLEMRSSSSRGSSSRPSLSRHSSSGSGEHLTIAMIAPTVLKTPGGHQGSLPQMIYAPPPEYLSPGQHPAASQFDFPSPSVEGRQRWQGDEDEEYGSVGFDYFGGPDLAGEDKQAGKQIQTHVGASYGRAPTVGQPPAQPKWRSAQPASVESSTSPSSSSSSGSLNQIISPQQTKGILKVRQASTTPPAEPSSPPNSYFNYNPSAATGIGGMRGAQYLDQPGPSGSPIVSPVITTEERGRSTSRERGRDRSLSRGTSSSTNSISPGAPSSPVGPTRRPAQAQAAQAPQTVAAPQLDKVEEDASWAEAEPMDEDYVPERSSTPTPHSSPQVSPSPYDTPYVAAPSKLTPGLDHLPSSQGHVARLSPSHLYAHTFLRLDLVVFPQDFSSSFCPCTCIRHHTPYSFPRAPKSRFPHHRLVIVLWLWLQSHDCPRRNQRSADVVEASSHVGAEPDPAYGRPEPSDSGSDGPVVFPESGPGTEPRSASRQWISRRPGSRRRGRIEHHGSSSQHR